VQRQDRGHGQGEQEFDEPAQARSAEELADLFCRQSRLRVLRAVKNRFGPVDEIGCFDLGDAGIVGVADPSGLFLIHRDIPVEAYRESMQLIGPDGRRWQGAEAVELLLGILPRGWLLGWIFTLPFAGRLADRGYRWFARHRARFGCRNHCG